MKGFLIMLGVLSIPTLVGLLITIATDNAAWIFVCNGIAILAATIWSSVKGPTRHNKKSDHDIDEYTNEYGPIDWWHNDK